MGFFDDAQKFMEKNKKTSSLDVLLNDKDFFRELKLRFPGTAEDKIRETLATTLKTLDSYADKKDLLKLLDRILLD